MWLGIWSARGGGKASHVYIDMGGLRPEDVLLMEFNTPEEASGFYNIYSRIKGFVTRQGNKKNFRVEIAHLTSMRDIGISIPKIYESFVAQLDGFNMITFTKKDMYNEFIGLEKSGATRFMHEMFWRYRESLKRCVWVRINACVEIEGGQMFNIQKFHKLETAWQVKHENAMNTFTCSCLRMESFGLPCILVVLVQLDVVVIPDSLVLRWWSKTANIDMNSETCSCLSEKSSTIYRTRLGAFS
ncbi:hypothetical protein Ahy_A08g040446 [Arachis hypogaea]|uniref:Protein FAR1-RELATED SEQUENCE n=1 Tax=Arachis hypogaea TaxID=3818 RepID=A0A445BZ87_ARAHY|nr:hypothetical protein Ahy_A08g040446 [Arachis hypogaea]